VLLDSLVAQSADGSLVVGRGIPDSWLGRAPIRVAYFPTIDGHRIGLSISSSGTFVSLTLTERTAGAVLVELPAFVGDLASTTRGTIDERAGVVDLPAGTRQATITLRHDPPSES